MTTRRHFFQLAALTAFLSACDGEEEERGRPRRPQLPADVRILNAALDLEHTAIAAYGAGAALLKGNRLQLARQFLEHEQEHAAALSRAIEDLGGKPHQARTMEEYRNQFPTLRRSDDVLRFAVDLENAAVRAYADALPKLAPELRRTAAAILTAEAEHISVLLGALRRPQVPEAFVTGKG